ncbi:MAG: hypothetical protein Q8M29_19810 [Bacteroidota bacterium]|nr:hypothetical protein [Bacteroidota bacterium]
MKKDIKAANLVNLKFIFCLSILFAYVSVIAQKKVLYPKLEKSQYNIGYKTIIDFDSSRTYKLNYPNDTSSLTHDPRPIITSIWYPANISKADKAMLYGDYIKVQSKDPKLKTFLKRIEDYNALSSSQCMFDVDDPDEEQKKMVPKHLKQPIEVFKNATPVNMKFPLVIYHPGLGGTLNDNTVLCEYLASNGFVVMSGAFQANDYKYVDLDWDLERSTKDIGFMLNAIKNLPFVDFSKIAAIGHSFGAQAVLGYKTQNALPISCLIILDSTVDYAFDAKPENFKRLTDKLYKKIDNMNVPMLVFAAPDATFKVMDSLSHAERIYATIELEHNEYTSLTSYAILNGLQERDDNETVWAKYTLINKYCLNYLKHTLFNDTSAKNFILSKHTQLVKVYEIPKGSSLYTLTPEYSDYSKPPSYLQFQKLLTGRKKEVIDKIIQTNPDHLSEDVINSAGYTFLKRDIDFAFYLFQKNVESHPKSSNVYDSMGEAYMIKGKKELAIKSYEKSIELNPNNKNALKMLEGLK